MTQSRKRDMTDNRPAWLWLSYGYRKNQEERELVVRNGKTIERYGREPKKKERGKE